MSRRGKSILRRLLKSYTAESWNHIIFKITQGQIDTESQKPRPWCWVWLSTLESRRPPGPLTQRWQRHQYCTLQPDLELPRDGASTSDGLIRRPCKSWPAGACCCVILLVLGVYVCACVACYGCGLFRVSVCGSCPSARSSKRGAWSLPMVSLPTCKACHWKSCSLPGGCSTCLGSSLEMTLNCGQL